MTENQKVETPKVQPKKEKAYYMMNMPEWFINLSDEKKMSLANEFAKDSPSDEILTKEDIVSLLSES